MIYSRINYMGLIMKNTFLSNQFPLPQMIIKISLLIVTLFSIPAAYAEKDSTPTSESLNLLNQEIRDAVVEQLSQYEKPSQEKTPTTDTADTADTAETKNEISETAKVNPIGRNGTDAETTKLNLSINLSKDKNTDTENTTLDLLKNKAKNNKNLSKTSPKRKKKISKGELYTINYIMTSRNNENKVSQDFGWIYLGIYTKRSWQTKNIDIGDTLPKVGLTYALRYPLNMRETLPKKTRTSRLLKILQKETSVKIIDLHPSGRNGHYWALVEARKMTKKR